MNSRGKVTRRVALVEKRVAAAPTKAAEGAKAEEYRRKAQAHALAGVRWGERISYGELAARAGRPGAPRAAGAFCSSRCYADLLLPAHRVVRSDGSLGEYGAHGVAYKQRLLDLETRA